MSRQPFPRTLQLFRGDALLGRGDFAGAAAAYRDALRRTPPGSPERERTLRAYVWALRLDNQWRTCAETALSEAPRLRRDALFASVVLAGVGCANSGDAAARGRLEPLAVEAAGLPSALRDDRFQLYQQLMVAAQARNDRAAVLRWGDRWLRELDATKPVNDDERSALDVARVDAASVIDQPQRVIPALIASERAMPQNYNASLRLAQMESAAKQYDAAIAACDRGLAHVSGPLGRSWLLDVKAEALRGKGDRAGAHRALERAFSFQCDEFGIAWSGADQVDLPRSGHAWTPSRIFLAPRFSSSAPSPAPIAAASCPAPSACALTNSLPCGAATMAVIRKRPCSTTAYAPIGTWQPPPSAASTARSAVTAS